MDQRLAPIDDKLYDALLALDKIVAGPDGYDEDDLADIRDLIKKTRRALRF